MVLDIWCAATGRETLSESVRYIFHTHTPEGRAAFRLAEAILDRHIIK